MLILCVISFFSCSNHDVVETPDPYQPVFDLFQGVSLQHIYLDDKKHQHLGPEFYSVIEIPNEDVQNNGMSWATLINRTIYSVSQNMESIKAFNLDTESSEEYSFLGRGPGEYQSISQLMEGDSSIKIVDGGSPRIKEYDLSLNFMDEYELDEFNMFYPVGYNHPYMVYPLLNNEDFLYRVTNLDNIVDQDLPFHKRLISVGKQPRAYNQAVIDIANNGDIAVLSATMPLMFHYSMNEKSGLKEPKRIVRFHHKNLETLGTETKFGSDFGENVVENPPPIEFEPDNSVVVGVTPLFQSMVFTEEWVFIKQIPDNRLVILKKYEDDIEYVGSFQFIDKENEPLNFISISYSEPWVVLGSLSENKVLKVNVSVFN